MGFFSLFSKTPPGGASYKSDSDRRRAGRRLVDSLNTQTHAIYTNKASRAALNNKPGERSMVPDENGVLTVVRYVGKVDGRDRWELVEDSEDPSSSTLPNLPPSLIGGNLPRRGSRRKGISSLLPVGEIDPRFGDVDPGSIHSQRQQESLRWNQDPHGPPRSSKRLSKLQHQHQHLPPPFPSSPLPFPSGFQPPFQQPFPQGHPSAQQPQPSFIDPMLSQQGPLGMNGRRAHVPGQSQFHPKQFGSRLDDPEANYKHLNALDELRRKNAEEKRRRGGGGGGGSGSRRH